MDRIVMSLLRGVCQMPAYVAQEKGFFREQGIDASINVQPTAWVVPERLEGGDIQFAVIPWTRVAAANAEGRDLVAICGSGCEEAAVVVRKGVEIGDVQTIAVPQEGGMKDLTASALMKSLGWEDRKILRLPSGDGAILAFVGEGAEAAAMVEPYATMLKELGLGSVVKRTGDLWPGAPGCSLSTHARLLEDDPELVRRVVIAFTKGAAFVNEHPDESAQLSSGYIGVHEKHIRSALEHNRPNVEALRNERAIEQVLDLMEELGYLKRRPRDFARLVHLAAAQVT